MAAVDTATIRVLIVDNHELLRTTLAIDLNQYAGLEVVGLAANGEEAIAQTEALLPDVILMDLQMPVMDGFTASKQIKRDYPKIYIIAYTSLDDPQIEVIAQSVPVDQVCYKDTKTEVLVQLIRQARDSQCSENQG